MPRYTRILLVGVSCGAMASVASAQDARSAVATPAVTAAQPDTTGVPPETTGAISADIIVTARRRDESLQDVPQTVDAVTGDTLRKLNLQRFEDIQAIVPGLTLSSGANGYTTAATIRGASFQVESGATPTVEFYLNDALTQSLFLFQSIFDVGQIEVLRGPQGTLRGRASPSGSITVATRRPALQEIGGYIDMTGTSRGGINANGAIGVPLIPDVLAIRVAGIVDENSLDRVHDVNNGANPYSNTRAGRISVRFDPTDSITANVMYQHVERNQRSFQQVESASLTDPSASPSDPVIAGKDRLGITDFARSNAIKQDVVTGQAAWAFAGQKLSYVGSYSRGRTRGEEPQDFADAFPGIDADQSLLTRSRQYTHEARLSSDERLFGMFDYTLGVFHSDFKVRNDISVPSFITLFGNFLNTVNTPIVTNGRQKETSEFFNLNWHVGDKTELSGGVRHIRFSNSNNLSINGVQAFAASDSHDPVVYNFSLSHRLNDNLLVYANTGSSWRDGPYVIGFFRPPTPRLTEFTSLKPETSKSYEIGFKANFFDKRLRFDIAGYHQDYHNFIYRGGLVNYVNQTNGVETVAQGNLAANVPATVNGIDLDASFQATRDWSMGLAFSYARGRIKNGTIACNDVNGDGVPDATVGTPTVAQIKAGAGGEIVGACNVSERLSFAPTWNLTAQSEYSVPLSERTRAFVRGLLTFYPHNPNDPKNQFDDVKAYGLLNLYMGLRSAGGAWEVSAFAKNLTNTFRVLSRNAVTQSTAIQDVDISNFPAIRVVGRNIGSSYAGITTTPFREFGVNIRYNFGSR